MSFVPEQAPTDAVAGVPRTAGASDESDVTEDHETTLRQRFLENLVEQHAYVAGDVIAIDGQTWAVHGTILVDGDVLMAEYHRADDAIADLRRLGPNLFDA